MIRVMLLLLSPLAGVALFAQAPKKAPGQFGIREDGITSPAMREAITRLNEAGLHEGKRGSLTFFRWTEGTPPKLAHLGLWGQKAGNEQFALIASLPDLEHVSIYETDIDDAGINAALKLKNLRTLSILPISRYEKAEFGPPQWSYPFVKPRADRPRVTGKGLKELTAIRTIEHLDLLDADIASAHLHLLTEWPKLGTLSLPRPIDDEAVKHLGQCKRLSALTIGHREITAAELTALGHWAGLKKLTIWHATLSPEALAALAKLESVGELHLHECGLKDEHLKHLKIPPKLTYLALERNEIDGPGIEHLTRWKLKKLGLEFNNISDKTLSHLSQLTTVDNLALSYCRGITDDGIRSGTLQKMTQLKQLGLRGCKQITDATLDDLVKFGYLEQITIRETGISVDAVEKMKKAMPKTVVFK